MYDGELSNLTKVPTVRQSELENNALSTLWHFCFFFVCLAAPLTVFTRLLALIMLTMNNFLQYILESKIYFR